MEVMLSVFYDTRNLIGKPEEFDPFVAVWTTDVEQAQTVVPGKAVDILQLDAKGMSTRSVSFTNAGGKFPIRDIMADVCISLYSKTESDGSKKDAGKHRPYTLDIGQINVPWHVIIRFMISEGSAYLSKADKDQLAMLSKSRTFPIAKVKQDVKSVVTYEGVEYEIQAQMSTDKNLAMELREVGAETLSRRGHIVIIASLVMTSEKTRSLGLNERIDRIEQYYLSSSSLYRGSDVKLGESHPSRIVKASQEYDRRTALEDETYKKAMDRYRNIYDGLWTSAQSGKKLIVKSHDGEKTILFKPDVPSMNRFHLPTWNNCNDKIPYAEWILQTVVENAMHLARPTLGTEHFLGTLADMAFKRVDISVAEFVATIDNITVKGLTVERNTLEAYLKAGSKESVLLVKSIEIVFYTIMMVAHATRYQNDGRMIKLFKKMVRVDAEAPQHGMVSGTTDDGDCEDEETPEIIIANLIELGRTIGDQESGGRDWTHPTLKAMRRVLIMYADYTIFGSVSGRQVSDAEKKSGLEDEEGFIQSIDDINEPIGGHTYMVEQPLGEALNRYKEHEDLVDTIVNYSVSNKIREFMLGRIRGWTGTVDAVREALLIRIWSNTPSGILEGTGRQEPLQLSLESYFGLSEEFLRRLAGRASEIDLIERWPKTQEDKKNKKKKDKAKKHRREENSDSDVEESNTHIQSMGEAAPYMFQKRLTILSMTKKSNRGDVLQRHISSFYRRTAHTVSCKLHRIMPNEFVHCIWVAPERHTYGPPLRNVLERGGDAIAIPLSKHLHEAYLKGNVDELNQEGVKLLFADLLGRRTRRIIPYDMSFQHLVLVKEESGIVASESAIASLPPLQSCSDFFCRSDFEHGTGYDATLPSIESTTGLAISSKRPLTIAVPSDSPIATAIQQVVGSKSRSILVSNVASRMVTRPPDGVISQQSIALMSKHVLAGAGVSHVNIYSERVLPWLSDNLCAHFRRDVIIEIKDEAPKTSRSELPPMSNSGLNGGDSLMSGTRLDKLMESSGITLGDLMDLLEVNHDTVSAHRLRAGILVELEHGTKLGHWQTNVTRDNLQKTAAIALAHLVENPGFRNVLTGEYIIPDYYHMLAKMEKKAEKLWGSSKKPPVFLEKHHAAPVTSSFCLTDATIQRDKN